MCKPSAILLLGVALFAAGCGPKEDPKDKEKPSPNDTGLKELKKEDLVVGKPSPFWKGQKPIEAGDRVYVRYKGEFANGTEFDSNLAPDKNAYGFTVGRKEVIPGWDEGILGMYPGGKRKLSVPYKLGYGAEGNPPDIPGKSDLFFEVEVIDVVKGTNPTAYAIRDLKVGSGPEAKSGSTVTIEYELRIPGEATVFDSSAMQNLKPTFKIGTETAMPDVEDGIIGMKVGGERDIWLPPSRSPKAPGLEGFPEDTITIYKVKLLSVK